MTFDTLSSRLRSFSQQQFGKGASDAEINRAEQSLGAKLPMSYCAFLREFGWGGVEHLEIYGLGSDAPQYLELENVTQRERTAMRPPIPRFLVPIMNDGAGNHYCLDTRHFQGSECPVVFWDHESGLLQEPQRVADNFAEWLANQLAELT